MKKLILLFLSLFVLISCVACDGGEEASSEAVESSAESSVASEAEKSEAVSESVSESESEAVSESESSEVNEDSNIESEAESESESEESQPESNVPSPLDLVGTWKRVSTEVEGDVNDGGNCTIIISGTTEDDLTVSYNDKAFPETAFSDKALTIIYEGDEVGFGNGEWYAVVEYVGAYETTYHILFEDGKLVLENSFMIDEMAMISIETFERAE